VIALTLLVLVAAPERACAQATRPPNVLLILADDLGYNDISLHGSTMLSTPRIDSIGKGGIRFTRGHTTCATCSPSRAGLLTGRNQQRFGYEFVVVPPQFVRAFDGSLADNPGNVIMEIPPEKRVPVADMGLPTSEITLAELLKQRGYRTGMVGKWHMGSAPKYQPGNQGFDHFVGFYQGAALFDEVDDPEVINARLPWDGIDKFLWGALNNQLVRNGKPFRPDKYMTRLFAEEGVRFIEENREQPFFLYMAFNAPHTPLQAPKRNYDKLAHIQDHKTRVYCAMIEAMDDAVGMLLDKLKEAGLEDNTLVVFSSDNGAAPYTRIPHCNLPLRGSKATYYQGGVVVPYLVRWPAKIRAGQVSDVPVSLLDVFPTAAAAAGAKLPGDRAIDGIDLLPFIRQETAGRPHQALYWRSGKYKAVLAGNYRLQIDGIQHKVMLYDIATDIGERTNLAESMPEKVAELRALLERAEAEFVEPAWPTPVYSRVPIDIWPDEAPPEAEVVFFPV
jgi:arylsulfatase A-like enzyme